MRKTPERPERLGWRDYFQMVTTSLMAVLSLYILWQTFFVRWAIPSLIFGVALLLFSLFRINMILAYFQQKGRRHGT
ncbi:MAG TPA: hypothetical protein VLZ03_09095 [Thermodesulfobacteriota bacterium]|nr:hypothetical protein [Thermodesulfobacteriota bacterium]